MVRASIQHFESFEVWTPTLFLVAGWLLVVYAVLNGMEAFLGTAHPTVQDVFGPAGFVFGFVGLLGLSPRFVDRTPRLAHAGAVAAVLGTVGFSVITVGSLVRLTGVTSGEVSAWLTVVVPLAAVGMIPGFLFFAVASLLTDVYSRPIGLLLLAPPSLFASMLVGASIGYTAAWSAFAISAGQALVYLTIGYSLQTDLTPPDREVSPNDASVI